MMRGFQQCMSTAVVAVLLSASCSATAVDPWADRVVSYTPGAGIGADFVTNLPFSDPATALGQPTRITSPDFFGSPVSPVNGPFRSYEIVTVGAGGELIVAFDEPVTDDPLNPFGIDLLVFGNAFFLGDFFSNPAGTASGILADGGQIAVSADGMTFKNVPGDADGLFPTSGYSDVVDPFATAPGAVLSDFTRPVDPAFNPLGQTLAQIVAGYHGSGGGLGIDLSTTGLSSISYVRITTPAGALQAPEIDAFADVRPVPEPSSLALYALAIAALRAMHKGLTSEPRRSPR